MKTVGYSKLGRIQQYDPQNWGPLGADNEAPMLLGRLARRNPEVRFVILGRNDGAAPGEVGLPANVENPYSYPDVRSSVKRAVTRFKESADPIGKDLRVYIDAMSAIFSPWTEDLDGLALWLGQTDQNQTPEVPAIRGDKPYRTLEMYRLHVSYYIDLINRWRADDPLTREPVWFCSDVWNRMKARDLTWPMRHPVLCQYDWSHKMKHYRHGDESDPEDHGFGDVAWWRSKDNGCWTSVVEYRYSALELGCSVPTSTPFNGEWEGRGRYGVLINQSRAKSGRDIVLRDWVLPANPDWVRGSWDESRMKKMGADIKPLPWLEVASQMHTVRSTLAVPIRLDMSWATPKAWEMFASGTACFFHPKYDDQGHILPTLEQCYDLPDDSELVKLARWLRVQTPEQLSERIDRMNRDRDAWLAVVQRQRLLFEKFSGEQECVKTIEARLGIDNSLRAVT